MQHIHRSDGFKRSALVDSAYGLHGFNNDNVFYGTEGYMIFSRRGAFSVFHGPKGTPGPTEGKVLRG
jgi:hypothetical protein